MKFFVDENISPNIAQALAILQNPRENEHVEVFLIRDIFGRGTKDEIWIPKVAERDGIVITQDFKIHKIRQQRELYQKHGLSVIFFKPPKKGYGYWDMARFIINKWESVIREIRISRKPVALLVTPNKRKPERL